MENRQERQVSQIHTDPLVTTDFLASLAFGRFQIMNQQKKWTYTTRSTMQQATRRRAQLPQRTTGKWTQNCHKQLE
jgi:hypothetical protein